MIVFQENHIEKSDTVIHAAANLYRRFFKHTESRSSLAGIQHTCFRAFQLLHVFACHSGNTAHALHHVQHQTFCLEQRLNLTFHNHCHITRFHFGTIVNKYLDFHRRVETVEYFFGNFDAGQHACFFD